MSNEQLIDRSRATLQGLGVSDMTVTADLISGEDRWGDAWTVLVCADADALAAADLAAYAKPGTRFVLAVAAGSQAAAREALETAGLNAGAAPNSLLVWGL